MKYEHPVKDFIQDAVDIATPHLTGEAADKFKIAIHMVLTNVDDLIWGRDAAAKDRDKYKIQAVELSEKLKVYEGIDKGAIKQQQLESRFVRQVHEDAIFVGMGQEGAILIKVLEDGRMFNEYGEVWDKIDLSHCERFMELPDAYYKWFKAVR